LSRDADNFAVIRYKLVLWKFFLFENITGARMNASQTTISKRLIGTNDVNLKIFSASKASEHQTLLILWWKSYKFQRLKIYVDQKWMVEMFGFIYDTLTVIKAFQHKFATFILECKLFWKHKPVFYKQLQLVFVLKIDNKVEGIFSVS
jgi:hypothetical protein